MNSFIVEHCNDFNFVTDVRTSANKINSKAPVFVKNNFVSGYFKRFSLPNELECLCAEYKTSEDFRVNNIPAAENFFILRVQKIDDAYSIYLHALDNKEADLKHNIFLLNSQEKFEFFASKNSRVRILEIFIPLQYFFTRLNFSGSCEIFMKYIESNYNPFGSDSYNIIIENIFRKIMEDLKDTNFCMPSMEKNVKHLLALLLSDISYTLHAFLEYEKVKISKEEILRLMTVRKYLDRDVNFPPPDFSLLTKMALMSGTSLKTKFKKMYGTSLFEYFQRSRMHRARILLLTHRYSVKQVGVQLGYVNLSNFTIAFKKEFHHLPHELIK